jgi:hypoxanthine-guanine phosphoribosyltransferase
MKPFRVPLFDFPDVVLHAEELDVKRHPQYQHAKAGDIAAAGVLVADLADQESVEQLRAMIGNRAAELVPIHALESAGVNEIPAALARLLSVQLDLPMNHSIVQTNSVGHTGASGFHRLANQALFEGSVVQEANYVVVDDFVGQGGTLANVIGLLRSCGGNVLGATVLTGKPHSAKLAPDDELLRALRHKHGRELESWWHDVYGFGFDCLTRSETRYLEKSPDAHSIRDRLIAAGLEGCT